MDSNERIGEKSRWERYKDSLRSFEQIKEAVFYKNQLYSHLTPILETTQEQWARRAECYW